MRTHTTSTLKSLIADYMHPDNQMSIQEIETWITVIPEIQIELNKQIQFFVHSIFGKGLVNRQLQQMQSECTLLLNTLYKYSSVSGKLLQLKNRTVECLEKTLDQIVNTYQQYADLSKNMCQKHYHMKMESLKLDLVQTKELMQTTAISTALKAAVLEAFNKLFSYKSASYNLVNYLSQTLLDVNRVLCGHDKSQAEQALISYLYEYHFNSERFIQVMIHQYQLETDGIIDLQDKLSRMVRMTGELKKHKVTPKKPEYLEEATSIYSRLICFFDTEMKCLAIAIEKAKPRIVPITAPVAVPYCPVDYKLRFNYSVECLAYLIKLMVTANIIEPGVKAELMRYVAANFETKGIKAVGISSGSFTTKFKNVTHSASVKVRASLMAMLKLIDKEF